MMYRIQLLQDSGYRILLTGFWILDSVLVSSICCKVALYVDVTSASLRRMSVECDSENRS